MSRVAASLALLSLILAGGHRLASRPPDWLADDPLRRPLGWEVDSHDQFESTGGEEWPQEAPPEVRFPLELNSATERELVALPGVGPVLARRIVAYRDSLGPFRSLPELDPVRGIGPVLLGKLGPLLRFDENSPPPPSTAQPLQNANGREGP